MGVFAASRALPGPIGYALLVAAITVAKEAPAALQAAMSAS